MTVLVQGVLVPSADRGSFSTPLLTVNGGIFQAIGVISFGMHYSTMMVDIQLTFAAFVCHHNSLLIYGSLKTPTIDNFSRVTHYSTGVSMLACLIMALGGFLTFGDKTMGNVLNNFSSDNSMVNVARLCFGLNMLTTLPLEAFVCREVMVTYFYPDEPFDLRRHLILSTALVAAATMLSMLTCDLGVVFELVGATSAVAMAYILPPMCYIKLTTRSWRTYVAAAIVVFGVAVMVISVIQAIDKMINGRSVCLDVQGVCLLTRSDRFRDCRAVHVERPRIEFRINCMTTRINRAWDGYACRGLYTRGWAMPSVLHGQRDYITVHIEFK